MSKHTDKYEIVSLLDASAYDNSGSKLGAVEICDVIGKMVSR